MDGFNGIAAITWDGVPTMMQGKSKDGKPISDIYLRWLKTAYPEIFLLGPNKDSPYFIGHTTRERFDGGAIHPFNSTLPANQNRKIILIPFKTASAHR